MSKLTSGSLAGTVSTLVLTQCGTGDGSQTLTRQFVSYMHFSDGGVIYVVARVAVTAQGLHIRARLSHSGSGGISS
jgi:hypothetical protein